MAGRFFAKIAIYIPKGLKNIEIIVNEATSKF
jgi:hypothetical protein